MTNSMTATESLSQREEQIIETATARPELTAAEIAAETGHIVPTVRDILAAHDDAIESPENQPATTSKPVDSASFNETEQAVLEAALRDPSATNREIAARVNTHVGMVRDIRTEYEAIATLPGDETPPAEANESAMEFDQELLSSAQEEILALARENPTLTNAEIADQTDSRLPLVRDTIATHGPEMATQRREGGGPTPTDSASFNETEQAVLEAALQTPTATNKEIAARVNTHVGMVRDIRAEYEDTATLPADHNGETPASTADGEPTTDTEKLSETQHAILEVAAENSARTYADIAEQTGARLPLVREDPTLTNAEIADQTDSRLPLVRDTIATHGPEMATQRRGGGGPTPTDSASFNETEQAVLEAALQTPTATNKEIAARVNTHVGMVRDIRAEYEDTATLPADHNGETPGSTADGEPTTDTEELSETQHAILEVAAENSARTYADIAEQTGARLPLVRDTLETYDPAEVIGATTDDTAESPGELSEIQQTITEHAAANPEQTYAEIAAETDTRVTLVRDTLEAHGDTEL